jgi:hypothetical protein
MSSDGRTFSNGRRKFKHSAMLGMALLSARVAAAQTSPAVEICQRDAGTVRGW